VCNAALGSAASRLPRTVSLTIQIVADSAEAMDNHQCHPNPTCLR
jgi:hypothetical protein